MAPKYRLGDEGRGWEPQRSANGSGRRHVMYVQTNLGLPDRDGGVIFVQPVTTHGQGGGGGIDLFMSCYVMLCHWQRLVWHGTLMYQ